MVTSQIKVSICPLSSSTYFRKVVLLLLRLLLGVVLFILLIMVVGSVILEEFPQLQPLFEELKMHVVNLYNISLVKYGSVTTILLIVAIVVLIGTSKRM